MKVSTWINLWDVPLELFTSEGIARIASAVGRPLYLDKATEERKTVSFARVCVEITKGTAPLKTIEVDIEGLGIISVRVEYPWMHSPDK